MSARVAIAVDVGGTNIKGAVVTSDGDLAHLVDRRTPDTGEGACAAVLDLVDELGSVEPRAEVIGVIVPGAVRNGVVAVAENIGWADLPLHRLLAGRSSLPIAIGHDARTVARAEQHHRALIGRGRHSSLLLVSLGTGVGSGYASADGTIEGASGAAGELGHVVVRPGGEACVCGQRGCVEAYASASALLRRYRAAGGSAASAAEVVARTGSDGRAAQVWADAVQALGAAIATAVAILDPEVVVLAGGLSNAGEFLRGPLAAALSDHLTWRSAPPVELTALGPHAGRLAAAHLAFGTAA